MREVNFTPADEIVDQLRIMHAPVEQHLELSCQGCDWGGFEGEEPGWPCRTAQLVFTEAEVADVLEAIDLANKWSTQRYRCTAPAFRNISFFPWPSVDNFIGGKVFPKVPAERIETLYRYVKDGL